MFIKINALKIARTGEFFPDPWPAPFLKGQLPNPGCGLFPDLLQFPTPNFNFSPSGHPRRHKNLSWAEREVWSIFCPWHSWIQLFHLQLPDFLLCSLCLLWEREQEWRCGSDTPGSRVLQGPGNGNQEFPGHELQCWGKGGGLRLK